MANNANTPTLKQKRFAIEYIKSKGNGAAAARKSYDVKPQYAHQLARMNLNKPVVQQEIQEQLHRSGLTLELLHGELLHAVRAGRDVKATQKDANQMIQFAYRLYNALPANKSMRLQLTMGAKIDSKNTEELISQARTQADSTSQLLQSFTSKR
jgi:hypothetical protein